MQHMRHDVRSKGQGRGMARARGGLPDSGRSASDTLGGEGGRAWRAPCMGSLECATSLSGCSPGCGTPSWEAGGAEAA